MAISAFDLFKIGIGPSSSHTVGPMLAANQFSQGLETSGLLPQVSRITAEMFGSLGATGKGHGTPKAVLLGLEGELPDLVDVPSIAKRVADIRENHRLRLCGSHGIDYNHDRDFFLHRRKVLPFHSNGMIFTAFDYQGNELSKRTFYSVGGGFVVDESASEADCIIEDSRVTAYPFDSAVELLALCKEHSLSISDLMLENEKAWRPEQETRDGLMNLWSVMQTCVTNGMTNGGILPGGLNVPRRAREGDARSRAATGASDGSHAWGQSGERGDGGASRSSHGRDGVEPYRARGGARRGQGERSRGGAAAQRSGGAPQGGKGAWRPSCGGGGGR